MGPSLNIIVVGAGIVGLATAISLTRKGHKVIVLEKVANLRGIGGIINCPPNSSKVLRAYGLDHLISSKVDDTANILHLRRYSNAEILTRLDSALVEEQYGSPNWRLARGDLQTVLMTAVKDAGIEVRLGCAISRIDESQPAAVLETGEHLEADLIVGADGVNSIVREAILPGYKIVRRDHVSAYYVEVDRAILQSDPELSPILSENSFWHGPHRCVVATNLFLGDRYSMVMGIDDLLGEEGKWSKTAPIHEISAKFSDFHPLVTKVLSNATPDNCLIWRFPELAPLPTWASKTSRLVLVGDAAHAMLPYAAQGAAMGLEDSACLAECLQRAASLDELPKVLDVYQKLRMPRVEAAQERGRSMHRMTHLPDGPAQEERDAKLRARPFYAPPPNWDPKHPIYEAPGVMDPMFEPYLLGYNIFEHTNRVLDEVLGGTV